jgi:excisionase family DNA binding protein
MRSTSGAHDVPSDPCFVNRLPHTWLRRQRTCHPRRLVFGEWLLPARGPTDRHQHRDRVSPLRADSLRQLMKPGDAITHQEAAELLGVHPSTVAHMVQNGELRSYQSKPSLSRAQVEAVAELRQRFRMSPAEAADQLGVRPTTVVRWLDTGVIPGHRTVQDRWRLDPEDVRRIRDEGPDLVTGSEAANILGLSSSRVTQLADADLIPYVEVPTRKHMRRLYPRAQLEVVAKARSARYARWHGNKHRRTTRR